MLGKAATHIRPLLRVPAHQPDLFTSNPSLLHHFQQQGIVSHGAAQAASGSGGSAGGAGRAGYSGASSGGYTGHARAFLSLPQTHSDASSIGGSADERKEKAAASRARHQLALNGRVRLEDSSTLPRTVMVRERLTERQGSRPVRVLEIEQEEPQARRSTIAYPAWAALPAETGRGAPVWIAGSAPRPLSSRAYTTRSIDGEVEYVSATPPPEIQRLAQSNRVLQDLAGLDITRPNSLGQVRRNSTASEVRPERERSPDEQADYNIYIALRNEDGDPAKVDALMAHYLAPRDGSVPVDPALEKEFPLPAGYSVGVYNACLSILSRRRQRGGSIGPILDTYNEMLSRDVIPTLLTSRLVIAALCRREEDIAAASRRWDKRQKLEQYKTDTLRLKVNRNAADEKAAKAIAAYQSEDNLASAINLWTSLTTFNARAFENPTVLKMSYDILAAAATAVSLPHATSIESLRPIIDNVLARGNFIPAFKSILYLIAGDVDKAKTHLPLIDQAVENVAKHDVGNARHIADAYSAAIKAYIAAGAEDKAQALFDKFAAEADNDSSSSLRDAMVMGYAAVNKLDQALEWMITKNTYLKGYSAFFSVADLLIDADKGAEMVSLFRERKEALAAAGGMADYRADDMQLQLLWARLLDCARRMTRSDALDVATQFVVATGLKLDALLLQFHVRLLIDAERWNDIQPLLLAFPARTYDSEVIIRAVLIDIAKSELPLQETLQAVRAFARLGLEMGGFSNTPAVMSSASSIIVQQYLEARSKVAKAADLGILPESWFRLLECFVALPFPRTARGDSDEPLKIFMGDLAELRARFPFKIKQFDKSPVVSDLAAMLVTRFGPEAARDMLLRSLGEGAAAHVPAPVPEDLPTPEFTLPPTAGGQSLPTQLQPPSAHTLHISPQLNALIERLSFGKASDAASVYTSVRDAITRDNAVPNPPAIGRLMVALARETEEAKVRELYSLAQVVLASCVPDPRAQSEAWCAIEDAMIAACCILGHLEEAGMHRARIIEAGFAPSADAYATMISSSRDSTDDALVARELFEESQRLNVTPNLYLYNTIISKLSKARKAEMAIELFTNMKAAGIRPSSVTYGAIINACCRVGDEQSATTLFEEMSRQPNFRPRVPPYNTMMQFHLQTVPSRDKVLHYYDAMRGARVFPSAHTYKILLDAYGTLAPISLDNMQQVFNELCNNKSIPVQATHWASLITAFGLHADDKTKAMQIFDSIPNHHSIQTRALEPVIWEAAINVLGQKGTLEELEALHKRMVDSGARQTAYVCNVLINGYSRQGAIDQARAVFEGMADSQTGVAAPNNHPALLTSSGHTKPSTMLTTDVVYREPSTYEAMVRAEVAAGDRERAEQVLKRMEERRYPVAVWWKARAILDDAVEV